MMTTQSDSDSSTNEEKEKYNNICLIANTSKLYDSNSSFLLEDFDELMNVIDSIKRKLKIIQIENQTHESNENT